MAHAFSVLRWVRRSALTPALVTTGTSKKEIVPPKNYTQSVPNLFKFFLKKKNT